MRPVSDTLKAITESLTKANKAMWEGFSRERSWQIDPEAEETVRYFLDCAFLQALFFLEVLDAPRMRSRLEQTYRRAQKDYFKIDFSDGEPFLARDLWAPAVNNHGSFGRWEFIEIADPWNAVTLTLVKASRIELIGNALRYVRYINDFAVFSIANIWTDTVVAGFASEKK